MGDEISESRDIDLLVNPNRGHRGCKLCASAVLTTMSLVLVSAPMYAQVYQWRDQNGEVHFTDTPPDEGGKLDKEIKFKSSTSTTSTAPSASSKSARTDKKPNTTDPNDPSLNIAQVLEAMKFAVTMQATVQSHTNHCAKVQAGSERYIEAKKQWINQNQDILKKIDTIKTQVLLFNGINDMDGYFDKIGNQTHRSIEQQYSNAPSAKQSADCASALRDIQNGQYDIVKDRVRHEHINQFFTWYASGKR